KIRLVEISRPDEDVVTRVVITVVVHRTDVPIELDDSTCVLRGKIGNLLGAVVRFLQDPGEALVVVDGENVRGFQASWLCLCFRREGRRAWFSVRMCLGFGWGCGG